MALMEAMACGLPAICSNIRGNTDLIEDGVCGLIVASTAEDVAVAVMQMWENPEMRYGMATAALSAVKKFDLISVEMKMKEIYESVEVQG